LSCKGKVSQDRHPIHNKVQNKLEGYASDFFDLTLFAFVTCRRFQTGQIKL